MASESSFYRVLEEADQLNRRDRAEAPKNITKPKGYKADGPNQVYSWDITYIASALKGSFYYLYLIEDIYSRKIVCWEIHESESAAHESLLIRKTCLAEGVQADQLDCTPITEALLRARPCLPQFRSWEWFPPLAAHQ